MTAFREIEDADVEPLLSLWRDCGLTRAWNDPYKDISFARQSADSTVLVAERDARIIASVMVGHDGHRGMLYYVAVAPGLQRQGLGRQAVRAAEAWLGARGVWKVNLLVRAENAAVKGFYESLGYEVNPVLCMARKIVSEDDTPC
jgi:ribosomal protein S18 acetylase RimI-like enzyme